MSLIYIDYNILVGVAGLPASQNSAAWRVAISTLADSGHRFVVSAWHAYELAKSDRQDHVDSCCEFVEALNPLWMSNNVFVKREEIAQCLQCIMRGEHGNAAHPSNAFNQTIAQMWATYGGIVIVGETFRNMVQALRDTPGALDEINAAAAETPGAIMDARDALAGRRMAADGDIVDREYFATLIDAANPDLIELAVRHKTQVLQMCPTIAVEEQLTQIRVRESFTPRNSDAADLQHALVALAYCDYFVSDDKKLSLHSKEAVHKCGLPCSVHRNPTTIP
jgi:hypothetical protein